jgi:RND family efflux transporter MFP subunit
LAVFTVILTLAAAIETQTQAEKLAEATAADHADASSRAAQQPAARIHVVAVKPRRGGLARSTTQPCVLIPDKYAELFAKAPGYLKALNVDIGSHVNEGDVLAVIDAPELHKEVARCEVVLKQANAGMGQAKARLTTARAEWEAAKALVRQLEASAKEAQCIHSFRSKVFNRLRDLAETQKAIDMKLVDEKEEQMHAAAAMLSAASAAVFSAESRASAALAKIDESEASVASAEAHVKACSMQLEKARVLAAYTTILSPYSGVVTARNFWPGDFVHTRIQGAALPLVIVEKTDVMRITTQVPDSVVPFVDPGDPAMVAIDALPGKRFPAKVSRVAGAEDPDTRTMRVEIDLGNEASLFHDGMYGRVTIRLDDQHNALHVPSSYVIERSDVGVGSLYILRNGVARKAKVRLGADYDERIIVLQGLAANEWLLAPAPGVKDGTKVVVTKRRDDRDSP